jgi:hypothetical protein
MAAVLRTAGEGVSFDCSLGWVEELIREGSAGELKDDDPGPASVRVRVEPTRAAFDVRGWKRLSRGAWVRAEDIVLENACASGFDLRLRCTLAGADFTYRWRPPARDRAASWVLRSRFLLLARAVLMQYPALWWAGTRGRAPLHASAWTQGGSAPLVTAQSGIGRSTLLLKELELGASATGDNLAVGDGASLWGLVEPMRVDGGSASLWGLVEPMRVDGGSGRRMTHGRREVSIAGSRVEAIDPDSVVVVERGQGEPLLRPCSPQRAEVALVTSTYMAGELRRYWPFAATLTAGTRIGPAHPPVGEAASAFASGRPTFRLALGEQRAVSLSELLGTLEVAA